MDAQLSGSHNSCQHNAVADTPLGMSHQHVSFHSALYEVIPANTWSQCSQNTVISQECDKAVPTGTRNHQKNRQSFLLVFITTDY